MTPQHTKVLFLIPSLRGGGAERVFSLLLRHLDRSRFEPHLAILQAEGTYLPEIPPDVIVHNLKVSRVRYALPRILRLVWTLRPPTILSTLGNLNLMLVVAKPLFPRGTRLVVRENAAASRSISAEARHPRLWEWLYRHFYARADKIICLSDSMVEDMAEHFGLPRDKLVRIYNPVDVEKVRRLAGIGGNPYIGPGPHMVALGRLSREKGLDVLLDALPAVLQKFPNAHLAILGEGPLQAELQQQAQRMSLDANVHFLGFKDNPWPYLKHADVFVLPSRYEGLPNALLEALALGTSTVACDCRGVIRELQDCDERMIVVPAENPVALGQAIISVCEAPHTCPESPEGVQQRMDRFSLQRVVGEYGKLF